MNLQIFEEKNKFYKWIGIAFFILLIMQLMMIIYINLTQMQYHMGYDASSYYLKAVEIWRQKKLFITNWVEQTTLELDTSLPLAALLYGACGDIFLAYGIADCIIVFALIIVFYTILRRLNFDYLVCWICLNFLLCPYITFVDNLNDLGYFSCMLTSFNAYGVKTLIVLMILKVILDFEIGNRNFVLEVGTLVMCFITSMSSGYYVLAVGIVPCFCWIIFRMFIENDISRLKSGQSLFLLLSMIVSVGGKLFAIKVLDFAAKDSEMYWMSLNSFWKNIGAIFLGFMQLMSALPRWADVVIGTDAISITYMFCLVLFVIVIFGVWYFIIYDLKKSRRNWKNILFLMVVVIDVLVFTFIYTTYENNVFESRYLIPAFLSMIILMGYFIQNIEKEKIFAYFGVSLLLVSLFFVDYNSDKRYIANKIDSDLLSQIVEEAEKANCEVVYIWGDKLKVEARNLRVYDLNRIYKLIDDTGNYQHWGDYTYYDNQTDYAGPVMLITNTEGNEIPNEIKERYQLKKTIKNVEIYVQGN